MTLHRLLLLALPALVGAAPPAITWLRFAVDERVSVRFPAPPRELPQTPLLRRLHVRVLRATNRIGTYELLKADADLRCDTCRTDAATSHAFYDGDLAALVRSQQGRVLARTAFATPAGEGVDVTFVGRVPGAPRRTVKYCRALLVGAAKYALTFRPADAQDSLGTSGRADCRRFFASLAVASARPAGK